jgi:hypothetical protein
MCTRPFEPVAGVSQNDHQRQCPPCNKQALQSDRAGVVAQEGHDGFARFIDSGQSDNERKPRHVKHGEQRRGDSGYVPAGAYLELVALPGGRTSDLEARAYALAEVIDEFSMPAILANRYQDALAANQLARALSPAFTPGQNFLRWRQLDPAARELYVDWDDATEMAVSGLRELSGLCPDDPRMR